MSDTKKKQRVVLIHTTYGDIKVKLYNETPLHRDNFIKLVEDGFYDSLLFHRVISDFMVQGGDPDSKNAGQGKALGNGGPGYTIPAEFNETVFHKRGALAAAREGDNVNPTRASSGSQFYIVQGRVFDEKKLDQLEGQRMNQFWAQAFQNCLEQPENKDLRDRYVDLRKANNQEGTEAFMDELRPTLDQEVAKYKFSEEQRKAYTTVGGSPHLDDVYTVFGEVIEGMDIIDSIAQVQTDRRNRPLVDVRFSAEVVK